MTLQDLMDLRGVLERGLAGGLISNLTQLTRQNSVRFQNNVPRIEIVVGIGAVTGARRGFPAEKLVRFTHRNFTAQFRIITRPAAALSKNDGESDADFQARVNANNNLHADIVALVRSFAAGAAAASWDDFDNFPNHFIAETLRDSGSPSVLKPQEGNETTTLAFSGVVGIRESAWLEFVDAKAKLVPVPDGALLDDIGIPVLDDAGQPILTQ